MERKHAISTILMAGVTLAVSFAMAPSAHATAVGGSKTFGLGFALGEPTSLVGKYFLGGGNAADFGVSFFHFGQRCSGPAGCHSVGYFGVFGDYLWQDALARGTAQLDWHFGPGGRLWLGNNDNGDNVALAARMPVGLDLTFDRPDFLELYLEVAPALYLVPFVDLRVEGMIGIRFYF